MRTRTINPGDLVLVNRKGRLFHARVTGLEVAGLLALEPLDRRISYRSARSREIVDHWEHVRADDPGAPGADQLHLDVFGD